MFDLSLFENPTENIYLLKKWNWDYADALNFQAACVEYVRHHQQVVILLICSHPHCFTLGKGLQKSEENLVDFNMDTALPFPLYPIKRGGGLTFHYPGQVIFYPILNLTFYKLKVYDLMLEILNITKIIIEKQFLLSGLIIKKDLLGLWFENDFFKAKLGSLGLAVNRFNTYHGMSLNFFLDEEMFHALKSLYPCGLNGNLYRELERLLNRPLKNEDREKFSDNLVETFIDFLVPRAQRF